MRHHPVMMRVIVQFFFCLTDITQFGPCNVSVIRDQAQLIVVNLLFYVIVSF